MSSQKQKIYLTEASLHTNNLRQTTNFSKTSTKGRIYSPLSKIQRSDKSNADRLTISIRLPDDLLEKIQNGEAEIVIPENGLFMCTGQDTNEFIDSVKGKRILRMLDKRKERK